MVFNITFIDKGITRDLEVLPNFKGYMPYKHVVIGTNLYNCISKANFGDVLEYNAGCVNWECIVKVKVNHVIVSEQEKFVNDFYAKHGDLMTELANN